MECLHTIWYCSDKYNAAVSEGKVCTACIDWYESADYGVSALFEHPGMLPIMRRGREHDKPIS